MLTENTEPYDVGVIIARFQVHQLHPAQRELIETVATNHDKVVILLGLSPLPTSVNNPLDFEARKQMILAACERLGIQDRVSVLYVNDQYDDTVWSRKVDGIVRDLCAPGQLPVLYGGRDSFIPHYKGRYPTRELRDTQDRFLSGTAVRRAIGRAATKGSPDFRAGVIWASQARFPTSFQCVDIAPLRYDDPGVRQASDSWKQCSLCLPRTACAAHKDEAAAFYAPAKATQVLLGRKPGETKFRFFGGFVDPTDESLEHAARRETAEEGGVELAETLYIGSTRVEDWRYRGEPDKIMTTLFAGKVLHGRPRPGDDIEEVRWFPLTLDGTNTVTVAGNITENTIAPVHRTLLQMLVRYLKGA